MLPWVAALLALGAASEVSEEAEAERRRVDLERRLGVVRLGRLRSVPRGWFRVDPSVVRPPFAIRPPQWPRLLFYEPESDVHLFVDPATFLALASSGPGEPGDSGVKDAMVMKYAAEMSAPDAAFPIPYFEVRYDELGRPFIFSHEGRHRAAAAQKLGLPAIPLIFFLKNPVNRRYPRPYEVEDDPDLVPVEEDRLVRSFTVGVSETMLAQKAGETYVRKLVTVRPLTPDGGRLIEALDPSTGLAWLKEAQRRWDAVVEKVRATDL